MHAGLILGLVFLAGCRGTSQFVATSTCNGKHFAQRLQGIGNFAQIEPFLYRGAQPDAAGIRELKDRGVKTIISLRPREPVREEIASAGMNLVEIPIRADILGSEPPNEVEIRQFFETVLDPAMQPVFFHCAYGKDRTGTMAALWRIERDGWTPEEAIEEMHAFGYHDYFDDLIDFVRAYHPRGFAR